MIASLSEAIRVSANEKGLILRDADFPLFSVFSVIFGPICSPISSFSF